MGELVGSNEFVGSEESDGEGIRITASDPNTWMMIWRVMMVRIEIAIELESRSGVGGGGGDGR